MWPVRVRHIARKQKRAWCDCCDRPIAEGDACFEVSWYEPGRVWSEYRCCGRIPRVVKPVFNLPSNPKEST